ncbi:MAG: hypothetical protein ABR543_14840 [Gemmatimonadaceae bacterium]
MLTNDDLAFFEQELSLHEREYLAGTNPRQQSGFGRDDRDWERFRRPVVAPVAKDGTFLDVGCANGLLMESVVRWAAEDGHSVEPYGIDISERLADLAWRRRLIVCSYGSSRPEGARAEPLVEEIRRWGLQVAGVHDVVSPEYGFVITRVISVAR